MHRATRAQGKSPGGVPQGPGPTPDGLPTGVKLFLYLRRKGGQGGSPHWSSGVAMRNTEWFKLGGLSKNGTTWDQKGLGEGWIPGPSGLAARQMAWRAVTAPNAHVRP